MNWLSVIATTYSAKCNSVYYFLFTTGVRTCILTLFTASMKRQEKTPDGTKTIAATSSTTSCWCGQILQLEAYRSKLRSPIVNRRIVPRGLQHPVLHFAELPPAAQVY